MEFNVYKEEFLSIGITNQYMLKGILDNVVKKSNESQKDYNYRCINKMKKIKLQKMKFTNG